MSAPLSTLRRKAKKRLPRELYLLNERLRERWWISAQRRKCAVCGTNRRKTMVEGHHVVEEQHLNGYARTRGITDTEQHLRIVWDLRNQVTLCRLCHTRNHNWKRRLTQDEIRKQAPKAWRFATDLDLGWYFDRYYPRED